MSCLSNLAELYHQPNQNTSFHRTIAENNSEKQLIDQNWTWELKKNPVKQ